MSAAVKRLRGPRFRIEGSERWGLHSQISMDGSTDLPEHSLNSVQSPLKPKHNEAAKKGECSHTFGVDVGEAALKGEYELARDKRVAALQQFLKPVQTAATTL